MDGGGGVRPCRRARRPGFVAPDHGRPAFDEHAVAVGVLERAGASFWKRRLGGDPACLVVGSTRNVRVDLATPLGDRVVVTYSHGAPLRSAAVSRLGAAS